MKKKPTYDLILFAILAVLSFMPMLQEQLGWVKTKPLEGVVIATERPVLTIENYRNGDFAKQEEAYVGENFGFREPIIRLYNQYLWDFYKKTYTKDVVYGKEGWLYYPQSVSDYYGTEMHRWHASAEEARNSFDKEVKYLNWVRTILKENDVELMVFMAPEKGFLYSEHLPEKDFDTTSFNARDYFAKKFEETGLPFIEMTRWFKQMKDTVNFPLIPQTGGHWNFSSVFAADSLFRYMETLKSIKMPKIHIGAWHESDKYAHNAETDLEQLLNLVRPIRQRQQAAPEAEVCIESDSGTVKPKVLFIGNSFFWRIAHYIPLNEMFDQFEFWYYYSTAYYGKDLSQTTAVVNYNQLEKLLDFDYVIWFTTGNQMYKGTGGFAKNALVALTLDDSLMMYYAKPIADSLRSDSSLHQESDMVLLWRAKTLIRENPEYIPMLRNDSLTLRSSEIPYAKYTKDIRKDSLWMTALEAQAFLRTASMKQMLHAEVDRIKASQPLYKDQTDEVQFGLQCQEEVKTLMARMPNNHELMESIKQKAEKYNKTIEKAMEDDAIWLIRKKYGLDRCRFIDDSDATIPLPTNILSK